MCGSLVLTVPILSLSSCLSRYQFLSFGNCHLLKSLRRSLHNLLVSSVFSSHPSQLPGQNFVLQVLLLIRNCFIYIRLPGQTSLFRVLILNSPVLLTVRLPGQTILHQVSFNLQFSLSWSTKVTVFFFCVSFPRSFRPYEVLVKTSCGIEDTSC